MSAAAGKKNGSAGDRGFVFRYDPVADSFLWAQLIDSDNPRTTGILEKTPGGNFVLYQNPNTGSATMIIDQEMEILELDRGSG